MNDTDTEISFASEVKARHPEAGGLDVGEFLKAYRKAATLGYPHEATIDMALAICGLPELRQPNREERRAMGIRR